MPNLISIFSQVELSNFFNIQMEGGQLTEFLFRFAVNIAVSYFIILKVYKPTRRDEPYVFTYLIFGPVVFFMVNLFAQSQLGMGFAFGLFAVFSILRYRTTTIPVKEMTYMFTIISLSVINAIQAEIMNMGTLVLINLIILAIVFFTERSFFEKGLETRVILYEKIENIHPDKTHLLISDIQERTGNTIIKFDVLESDYLRDSVKLRVYFKSE